MTKTLELEYKLKVTVEVSNAESFSEVEIQEGLKEFKKEIQFQINTIEINQGCLTTIDFELDEI